MSSYNFNDFANFKEKSAVTEPNADVYHQHEVSKSVKHEINVLSDEKQKPWPLLRYGLAEQGSV